MFDLVILLKLFVVYTDIVDVLYDIYWGIGVSWLGGGEGEMCIWMGGGVLESGWELKGLNMDLYWGMNARLLCLLG